MKTYQYQILRFLPDRVTGEFVNLGIVVFDLETQYIKGQFFEKIKRVSSLFPSVNGRYLATTLRYLQKYFEELHLRTISQLHMDHYSSLEEITKAILPKDNSSLFFTEVNSGIDISFDIALEGLFERIVTKYVLDEDREHINDREVWSKIYKKYFDELGISNHLQEHTIKTKLDHWKFEKAWKNGVWNCFETVSFDLSKADSIKDKVYKWAGRIGELATSKEPIHLYLLSKLPSEHPALKSFINQKIGKVVLDDKVTVELIIEEKAEGFARKIKKVIETHEND